ncbi:isopeptide-forming domain-containing fimbrial protein [Spirulina sp. CS-785/01]|uniref:isopeptide-forming domain-containing fimbrial protein n=1 Tax=Spirulina sp. CS-785/01 TaxID=3021716 RepID=UPI0023311608|nr:isopeptide-forming domain-containing fimbrial protein [Spirulina sp. CS-785/01]MDB9315838.1 isopeptide-forming domain-containing fimbrial protein [Spirulina sp. CS-785/01]
MLKSSLISITVALFFLNLGGTVLAEVITNTGFGEVDNSETTSTSNPVQFSTDEALPTSAPETAPGPNNPLELIKSADRAAAEPGETVIYRLTLRNINTTNATDITVTDQLPLGLNFLPNSVQVAIEENGTITEQELTNITTDQRTLTLTFPELEVGQTLNIVYAAVITPDAMRGGGRNIAQETRSNLASFLINIQEGILSDCGTIIGRVFVDKNFDGEQQRGEPGIPNAVIFLQDGNRVTTDENGLFSLANILAGYYNGTLDLTSLPGYQLAQNQYFIERNSQSRFVRLEPGGLVRMNFAVTPLSSPEHLE